MASLKLLESDSSSGEEDEQQLDSRPGTSSPGKKAKAKSGFQINASYADHYDRFRQKEVFEKLKAKYGEDAARERLGDDDDDRSESSSEDDSEAEALTEQVERDFFKTLSSLKGRDPRIYDGQTKFFQGDDGGAKAEKRKSKKTADKPMTLSDLQRKVILEKGGQFDEMEDAELERKMEDKTYVQEMEDIRQSLRRQVTEAVDDNDDNDDEDEEDETAGFLKPKSKTREEKEQEESDYQTWLKGQKTDLADTQEARSLQGLKDFWNRPDLPEDEKFLKDYILNKRYLGHEGGADDDDDGDDDEGRAGDLRAHDSDSDLSADEANLERQEDFEHKFNFRFEEPDPEFIKRYPRTVKDSMRRQDNSRKKKREEVRERKKREEEQRKEELKQLKAMKRKEIMGKLTQLEKVAGKEAAAAFADDDVEGDFDPAAHDKRMAEVFAKYDVEAGDEDEKPEFSDLDSDFEQDLETENWDEWEGQGEGGGGDKDEEDDDEDDDNESQPGPSTSKDETQQELIESTRGRKKRRKSKFAEVLEKQRPVFDPKDKKTFEQYLDEYYKLDYEDLIGGDVKCRFKYREVEKNDFGLSAEEVLSAPDRELNAWCTLKKTCLYRSEQEEKADVQAYRNKGMNIQLKKKILPSLFVENPEAELEAEQDRKRKRRKGPNADASDEEKEAPVNEDGEKKLSKSQKRKRRKKAQKETAKDEDEAGPQQKRPKLSNSPQQSAKKQSATNVAVKIEENGGAKKKKRNRGKGKEGGSGGVSANERVNAQFQISDERLQAYGLAPNKFKRKIRQQKYREAAAAAGDK